MLLEDPVERGVESGSQQKRETYPGLSSKRSKGKTKRAATKSPLYSPHSLRSMTSTMLYNELPRLRESDGRRLATEEEVEERMSTVG